MRLYHFTALEYLDSIVKHGAIFPSESNVSLNIPHAGPDVVWLLDTPTIDHSHGLEYARYDKTSLRVEVEVPAIHWLDWTYTHQMSHRDFSVIVTSGGGMKAANHWYVWPGKIKVHRWRSIVSTLTGETLWTP